jgi:O-antigen ligase
MMGPILSVGSVALSGVLSATFAVTSASNAQASGGYGPNQVSSILGLGAMLSLLLFLATRGAGWLRGILFSLMVGFACQSALTFSRGGLYTAAGAAAAALPFVVRDRAARWRLFSGGIVALGLAVFLVLPSLERFTGGALAARFEDTGTTGRDRIAMADLTIWSENPILGVGPGRGPANRLAILGGAPAAHTEWSRLLAEHGLLGLGAAVCLIAMAWRACARDRRPFERALAAGFATWAFLFMFHAGMRLAAPAFAVGLAQCRIKASSVQPEERRV